ncbi:MAG: transcriptional regulator [Clostridiales bacterium 43-6]|nr:MAG: transcriptional regulator [Clostridiales bacterium 43-6]
MKKLEIIIRPDKLETLKEILDECGCGGMTIMAVMGCGQQKGSVNQIKNMKVNINLLPKIQVNAVIKDEQVENTLLEINTKISSGTVGDGKVFVYDVDDAMRIRTGERGGKAI